MRVHSMEWSICSLYNDQKQEHANHEAKTVMEKRSFDHIDVSPVKDRLPEYQFLTRDGRDIDGKKQRDGRLDLAKLDGGVVQDRGRSGIIYKIYYDNIYQLNYRLQQRSDMLRDVLTQKYITGIRILMFGFDRTFAAGSNS